MPKQGATQPCPDNTCSGTAVFGTYLITPDGSNPAFVGGEKSERRPITEPERLPAWCCGTCKRYFFERVK
jgi:hypothetical protein